MATGIDFPAEQHVTKELIEVSARAAVAELIATGTTFACDMHYPDVTNSSNRRKWDPRYRMRANN